jgi:V/A-type H+-transporting ATPase subunit C
VTAGETAARAEIWTYASGRVAALEAVLLGREALLRLAEAETDSAVASALSESPLRGPASEARTPAAVAEVLSKYYAERLGSLKKDCPSPAMFELVALPARFRDLKAKARDALAASDGAALSSEALREVLGDFAEESEAASGLRLLAGVLADEDSPEPGLLLDLTLDSSRLLEALRLARLLGEETVAAHAADEVAVRSVLVVWRSKLAGGDLPDASGGSRMSRLFLRAELSRGLAARLWALPLSAWGELLSDELTRGLGGELYGRGEEEGLDGWEKAAFDWLTSRARELRGVAFGVGRVYGYAWGLAVEERNLRLALVGRVRGVEPAEVKRLLWESYG